MAHEYQPPDRNLIQELARKNVPLSYSIAVGIFLAVLGTIVTVAGYPIWGGLTISMSVIFVIMSLACVVIPLELLRFVE